MKLRADPVMYGSRAGNGHRIPSEAYDFQGIDLATWLYGSDDLELKRPGIIERSRSLEVRYAGERTPYGTRVVDLCRAGDDLLTVPCGYCTQPLGRCRGSCE